MRNIPAQLQTHLDLSATTTTRLLKVILKNGFVYGLTMLDRDVTYDDGDEAIVYAATNGFDPTTLSSDVGFTVDNAESLALLSEGVVEGITLEMAERGDLNDAQWIMYLVNFEDLTPGRHVILDSGDVGEVRVVNGVVWMPELLSYATRLKQSIGGVWSRRCRATFGTPNDTPNGCGIDAEGFWVAGEVTVVGAESDRVFTGDSVGTAVVGGQPARVRWITGDNEGVMLSTEDVSGHVITLGEPTPRPIAVGDQYEIRPDCGKRFLEDCVSMWNNGVNFRGEPHIPVGDAAAVQTPGTQVPNFAARRT